MGRKGDFEDQAGGDQEGMPRTLAEIRPIGFYEAADQNNIAPLSFHDLS
jgi:hypothetical protein